MEVLAKNLAKQSMGLQKHMVNTLILIWCIHVVFLQNEAQI